MAQHKILIAQFPHGSSTHPAVSDWVTETVCKMRDDPSIGPGNIFRYDVDDTPITMSRNRALVAAEAQGIDFILMVDSDMKPDVPTGEKNEQPFWESSWKFALEFGKPCVIAAPYCGPPPNENIYVFRWSDAQSHNPNPSFKLEQYTRFEATQLKGILPASALATGLILIDMRAIKLLKHPRFYYEWSDERQIQKGSTEDVTFSRDLSLQGVPLFCNWDAWAGHYKLKCVSRPVIVTPESVGDQLRAGLMAAAAPK